MTLGPLAVTRSRARAGVTLPQALAALRASLGAAPAAIGAEVPSSGAIYSGAAAWVDYAGQLLSQATKAATAPGVALRDQLLQSADALRGWALVAYSEGAAAAGDILLGLSERVADSAAALGRGAGEAFRNFWGFDAGTPFVAGFGLLGLVALGGLALFALTPGGQLYVAAIGRGAGQGIASTASGMGSAVSGLGKGLGQGLAETGKGVASALDVKGLAGSVASAVA